MAAVIITAAESPRNIIIILYSFIPKMGFLRIFPHFYDFCPLLNRISLVELQWPFSVYISVIAEYSARDELNRRVHISSTFGLEISAL